MRVLILILLVLYNEFNVDLHAQKTQQKGSTIILTHFILAFYFNTSYTLLYHIEIFYIFYRISSFEVIILIHLSQKAPPSIQRTLAQKYQKQTHSPFYYTQKLSKIQIQSTSISITNTRFNLSKFLQINPRTNMYIICMSIYFRYS